MAKKIGKIAPVWMAHEDILGVYRTYIWEDHPVDGRGWKDCPGVDGRYVWKDPPGVDGT